MINFKVDYHNIDLKKIQNQLDNKYETVDKINKILSELPCFNIANEFDDLQEIELIVENLIKNKDHFLILGTGGSSLGARALVNILNGSEVRNLIFCDNIDPIFFENLLKKFNLNRLGIIVISKSGHTSETLSQFASIIEIFQKNNNLKSLLKDCVVITENKHSPLRKIAGDLHCKILPHHSQIGGRFSVFSNVGLLPAAISGLNITNIRKGALNLLSQLNNKNFNDHIIGAEIILSLHNLNNVNLNVLMTYADSLQFFGKWFLQLWSESIGKNTCAVTPIHSVGTTDQHSQLQLYLDGPRDKFFTFITKQHSELGLTMNNEILKKFNVGYLAGKKMGDLMNAEQNATIDTFIIKNFPLRQIHCKIVDEFLIGELMTFIMMETIAISILMGVNPFDQPAVEEGKILTKKYLS